MDEGQKRSEIDRGVALSARDWIVRLASGDVTNSELDRFHAWCAQSPENRRAFAREREFWQLLQGVDGTEAPKLVPARRSIVSRRAILTGAVVAATVAVIAAPRVMRWLRSDFATGPGELASATLPDGSTLLLNTDSSVAVDFRSDQRLVDLIEGEVEVSVAAGRARPFRVAALGGLSEAEGGRFAVRSLAGEATVTASEGLVSVSSGGMTPGLLSAGQQTRYRSGGVPQPASAIDMDTELAWRTGRIVFDGKPFGKAMQDLGRYVPERVVVTTRTFDENPVSAVFQIRDAHAAIEALAHTQGLVARRIPGVVVVIS